MAHSRIDIHSLAVTERFMYPSLNFMALARAARSLPDTTTTTLSTRLHDKAKNAVCGAADSKPSQQLVLERLHLGLGAETTVGHALGVELNLPVGVSKGFCTTDELADALAFSRARSGAWRG